MINKEDKLHFKMSAGLNGEPRAYGLVPPLSKKLGKLLN